MWLRQGQVPSASCMGIARRLPSAAVIAFGILDRLGALSVLWDWHARIASARVHLEQARHLSQGHSPAGSGAVDGGWWAISPGPCATRWLDWVGMAVVCCECYPAHMELLESWECDVEGTLPHSPGDGPHAQKVFCPGKMTITGPYSGAA